ncbi:MAG: serine/threonine protein kinase [Deltaproteobacteria bacterium]|nr:serine/threonine protein kinase [Deltaproteobacteria bacterium]
MEVGQIIGRRWRISRKIGSGAMGSVYEVEHIDLGTVRAVKQLKPEFAADETMVRGFVREAQRLATLATQARDESVRHIVQVFDLEHDEQFGRYFFMELIRGNDLRAYRAKGALPFAEVVRIGSEIAMALGLAHKNHLIHCDVKPANILIEETTLRAVVTDFGISKRLRTGGADETATTMGIGGLTYRYAAPEQVRSEDFDQRADLYALGAVLYEVASGQRFADDIKEELQVAMRKAQPGWRPPLALGGAIPAAFVKLLEDLLENTPDRRIDKAAVVIARLGDCLADFHSGGGSDIEAANRAAGVVHVPISAPEVAETVAQEKEPSPARRKGGIPWRAAGAAAAALLAAAAVAFYLWTPAAQHQRVQPAAPAAGPISAAGDAKQALPAENRPPITRSTSPPQGEPVSAEVGKRVQFSVDAADPDGDALQYAWTVDDRAVGTNAPSLEWEVAGDAQVAVAINDGKSEKPVLQTWKLASIHAEASPPAFDLPTFPPKLASLKFQENQKFEVTIPAGVDAKQLAFAWTLDGEKVADTPAFQFSADDPQWVRSKPIHVTVNARDDKGRVFKHDWQFKVVAPAPPRIVATQPAEDQPQVQPGTPARFELSTAATANGQTLSYVFSNNGAETRSAVPHFEITPEAGHEYTVVAYATDNFGQASTRKTWMLKLPQPKAVPAASTSSTVQEWLDNYRQALMQKKVDRLQDLLQLSASKVADLQKALDAQCDLKVEFNNTQVQQLAADQYRARYDRLDKFTDCKTLQPISKSASIEQTFRVVNGQVQLQRP